METYLCASVKCGKLARSFCTCQKRVVYICEAHVGSHLASPGNHCITNIYRQLDEAEREMVQGELLCLEIATKRTLEQLQGDVDRRAQKIVEELRRVNEQHAKLLQTVILQSKHVKNSLRSMLTIGIVQEAHSKPVSPEDSIRNLLSGLKLDVLRSSFNQFQKERSQKLQLAKKLWVQAASHPESNNQEQLYREAAKLYEELNLKTSLAAVLVEFGSKLNLQSQCNKACAVLRKAESICRDRALKKLLAKALLQLGRAHINDTSVMSYKECVDVNLECTRLSAELNLTRLSGDAFTSIGQVSFSNQDYDRALSAFHEVVQIYRSADWKDTLPAALNNLGRVYTVKTMHKETLALCREAVEIARDQGDSEELKNGLILLEAAYQALGMGQESFECQRELEGFMFVSNKPTVPPKRSFF